MELYHYFPIHTEWCLIRKRQHCPSLATSDETNKKQEVLGRTNRLLFFDTTRAALNIKKFGGDTATIGEKHRQLDHLTSLISLNN
jgi:hypothetical protein